MLFKLGERGLESHLMMALKSMEYVDLEVSDQLFTLPFGEKSQPRQSAHEEYEVSCNIFSHYAANTLERIIQASSERWGSPTIFSSSKSFLFCLQAHVELTYSLIHSTHKTLRFYILFYFFCSPSLPLSCSLF